MKKTLRIISLVLVLVMSVMVLASCSSYGKIQKAFEKEGYVLQNADNEATGTIETEEGTITYTIHVFEPTDDNILGSLGNKAQTITVWEFSSDKELAKAIAQEYKDDADIKEFIDNLQESDYVNGNCFLLPNILNPNATEIFKGTK